jgi:hypothetical protein
MNIRYDMISSCLATFIVCWLNECYFPREEFICLRVWDRHVSRHMTKWRRAEDDMCVIAATLLEVSEAQGVLKYSVDFTNP